MLFSQQILELIRNGIGETLCMVVISTVISYMIGIPLGIILVVTDKEGIRPIPALQKVLGLIINLLRSVPFLILLIMMIPVTRKLVGTSLGWRAVVPPLVASAAPYIARMVESSFKEIDAGVIEAAKSMGASTFQIIWKVLLPGVKTVSFDRSGHLHHHHTRLFCHGRRGRRRRTGWHCHQLRLLPL